MQLFALGLNHHSAPIEVRECLAIPSHRLGETLLGLRDRTGIAEIVLLSTCNRFEAYLCSQDDAKISSALYRLFRPALQHHMPETHLYEFPDSAAARHLFRVAAGLDSMVLGEHEILGQVKQAYVAAHAAGTTGKLLNVLFQRSLFVGKRVRTETGLARGAGSVASLAVAMAKRVLGCLEECRVMILGAGEMAERTARHLLAHKVRSFIVSNRTYERACDLAARFGGLALGFREGLQHMADADIVICSTAAPHPVIRPELVREMMGRRRGRPLIFIDIAMPRDVHPEVHCIENVHVYDLDDLQAIVDQRMADREKEKRAAEAIVEEQVQEFQGWLASVRSGRECCLRHCSRLLNAS